MNGGYIICGNFEFNFTDDEYNGTIPIDPAISESDKPIYMGIIRAHDETGSLTGDLVLYPCLMMPVETGEVKGHSGLVHGMRGESPMFGIIALVGDNIVFTPILSGIS